MIVHNRQKIKTMRNKDIVHRKNKTERINNTSREGKHNAHGKWKKTRKKKMMIGKSKKDENINNHNYKK